MKEAIITGPTGAVGAALIRRLLQEDFRIYAVVRPNSRRLNALPADPRVVRVFCDLSELNRLPELIPEPCEVFFHFAWAGTTGADRNDRSLQEKNVEYSLDALRAAKALSCSCFLFSGTQAEYGRSDTPLAPETPCHPENEYGKAKLEAGLKLKAEAETLGIRMIHVRILSVYGPDDGERAMIPTVIRSCLNGVSPQTTEGRQIWDYLYEDDAAEALYLLSEKGRGGKVYPLGSGSGRPLREYLEILRDEAAPGLPIHFGAVPYQETQVMFLQSDNTALFEDTGFVPSVDFRTGIRRTIDAIKS